MSANTQPPGPPTWITSTMWLIGNGLFPIAVSAYVLVEVTNRLQQITVTLAQQQLVLAQLVQLVQ